VIPLTQFGVVQTELLDSACLFMEPTDSVGCPVCSCLHEELTQHRSQIFNLSLSSVTEEYDLATEGMAGPAKNAQIHHKAEGVETACQ
jgi:hypothetical protein